jgi:hypothetical protein
MNSHGLRVIAIAALASSPIVVGGRPVLAQAWASAPAGAALPDAFVLAQAAPAPAEPIALPRVRDYEAIPELRDVHFDFGKAVIRPGDELLESFDGEVLISRIGLRNLDRPLELHKVLRLLGEPHVEDQRLVEREDEERREVAETISPVRVRFNSSADVLCTLQRG